MSLFFSGYLNKKIESEQKRDKFRKRWFELRGNVLSYFKEKNGKLLGTIGMGKNLVVKEYLYVENSFMIKRKKTLYTHGIKMILEEADDKGYEEWIEILNKTLQSLDDRIIQTDFELEWRKNFMLLYTLPEYTKVEEEVVSILDFERIERIGRGAFGKIEKVRSLCSGNIYTMKVIKKEMITRERIWQYEYTMVESKKIPGIFNHPNLCRLCFVFHNDTDILYFLEYVSGGELFEKGLKFSRPFVGNVFTIDQSRFYISQIILAIEFLHQKNVIYRDLNPANLLLDKYGNMKISGIHYWIEYFQGGRETHTTFCGTPEYLAPEIILGEGSNVSVDWWSVGVILYEMMFGFPPFYSESINEMYEFIIGKELEFPKNWTVVDEDLKDLISKLLIREPEKRIKFEGIKEHPFFTKGEISWWEKLERMEIDPPFFGLGLNDPLKLELEEKDRNERLKYIIDTMKDSRHVISLQFQSSVHKSFSMFTVFLL